MSLLSQEMILVLLCAALPSLVSARPPLNGDTNDRPIIGVVAQEVRDPVPGRTSYIAASYVKYLESAGARVVPVMINRTDEDYKTLFSALNGILFPGGGVSILSSSYARTAKVFYQLAVEANKRGDYFPVWGTCLGMEELTFLTSGQWLLTSTNTENLSLPLKFTQDAAASRMFKDFPPELMKDLATEPLTANVHKWSLALSTYNQNEALRRFYKVLSTNTDGQTEFVSTMEAHDYPIYATQWHPEKNTFEWKQPFVSHTASAVRSTFYMAQLLVSEARKSLHGFQSPEEENKALIYQYSPVYTGPKGSFEQIYFF